MTNVSQLVAIDESDHEGLVAFAKKENIDLHLLDLNNLYLMVL